MNFKPRHFIFSIALLLSTTFSFAQNVFIANDFVACAVGLKDSSGKWIVEPIYQSIYKWRHGYFHVLYGSKEGVIDSTGKIIIPPIYDYVNYDNVYVASALQTFFTVTDKGKSGLVNSKNQFIIPMVCRKIEVGSDGTIIAEKAKKRYSIYDLAGRETVIPKKQGTEPFILGEHMYKVSKNSFGVTFVRRYFPHSRKKHRRYRWRITLRKKYGVMNDSLQMIIPKKFSNVYYNPGKYKLVTVEKRKKTGYYTRAGKEIWAPEFKIDYSFKRSIYGKSQSVINANGFTAVRYHKKYGIIGVNGDTLLPFIYKKIAMPYSYNDVTSWTVELETSKGYTNDGIYNPQERKWVLEPIYQSLSVIASFKFAGDTQTANNSSRYSYYDDNNSDGLKLILARKDGKYGLITSAGDELLPFVYDDYNRRYGGFCLMKDSSYYMLSIPKFIIPRTRYSYQNIRSVVKKAPADLKFKKMNAENGVTLFINPELIDDSAQLALYQLKGEDQVINPGSYRHLLHATAITVTPLYPSKTLPGIGQVYSYHTSDLNYNASDSIHDFTITRTKSYFSMYDVSKVAKDKYHSYYSVGSHSGLYRDDGFVVIKPSSYNYFSPRGEINGIEYFSINVGKRKTGLINGDGKLLLDTVWGAVGTSSGKYVWVNKKSGSWYWSHRSYIWNILDTTTNELLLHKKLRSGEALGFGLNAVIIERKEGEKLYNMDMRKYILDGNVRGIFKLDPAGKYFAVRTCYGNIGIIDGNGKWLTDTIWKVIIDANNIKVNGTSRYRSYYYRENLAYNYCVLSNDTGWIIFDGDNGIVTRDEKTVHYLLGLSFNSFTQDSISGLVKFCISCPSYSYTDTTFREQKLASWQESILFDSLFAIRFIADTLHNWTSYGCADCRKRNPKQYFQYTWSGNYDQEVLHHYIDFKNENCISVSRDNLSGYSYQNSHPKDLFFTAMLFSDGPHAMLLDSLFTGTEWQAFISAETNLYFESHPNIQGNCLNPYMLPVVMKDRFVLTPDGIELYPPNYKENDQQLFVPISWEKLKPYLRKDVAGKLELK